MKSTTDKEVRERLLVRGERELTEAELLSLVIGSTKGEESILKAEEVLGEVGSIVALQHIPLKDLRQVAGLGMERAIRVKGALELGRRMLVAEGEEAQVVRDRNDVVTLFAPILSGLDHEEMWVLYLSSAGRVIERRRISVGGSSSLLTDTKLILRQALNLVAASIIVVHNHPSGNPEPSGEDHKFTERLKAAAELLDVVLLDHIIISRGGGSYSFRSASRL